MEASSSKIWAQAAQKNIDFELQVTVLNLTEDKFLDVKDGPFGTQLRMNLWSQFHSSWEAQLHSTKGGLNCHIWKYSGHATTASAGKSVACLSREEFHMFPSNTWKGFCIKIHFLKIKKKIPQSLYLYSMNLDLYFLSYQLTTLSGEQS